MHLYFKWRLSRFGITLFICNAIGQDLSLAPRHNITLFLFKKNPFHCHCSSEVSTLVPPLRTPTCLLGLQNTPTAPLQEVKVPQWGCLFAVGGGPYVWGRDTDAWVVHVIRSPSELQSISFALTWTRRAVRLTRSNQSAGHGRVYVRTW